RPHHRRHIVPGHSPRDRLARRRRRRSAGGRYLGRGGPPDRHLPPPLEGGVMSSTATLLERERELRHTELSLVTDPDPARTGRDPEFIERNLGLLETFSSYFNPE